MSGQGFFITGTDTGVGKTRVSAVLLAMLRARDVDAVPMKPIQTGAIWRRVRWLAPDLDYCLKMAGLKPDIREYVRMAPYCFAPACSPHLAAAMSGRRIEFGRIQNCLSALQARHALVVVEGAGGIFTPLRGCRTMLDLIVTLDLPVVVVARPGLGTINHTLLTLQGLRRARARVLGVVFNASTPVPPGLIERDNVRRIARLGAVRVLGYLPFMPEVSPRAVAQFNRPAAAGLPPVKHWLQWISTP